jgi:CRP-like cAMP-binding protein
MTNQASGEDLRAHEPLLQLICGVFGCAPELAKTIRGRGMVRDHAPRSYLVRTGDPITILFVIADGLAQAIVYSSAGQPVLLHEYRRGDFFGAVDASATATHEADVVAASEVSTFVIAGRELALLAEQHGCIGLALLRVMVDRLQRADARMYETAALSAAGRVHAELLRQARQGKDLCISPVPVLTELALLVSTSRETVSRAVSALERRGIVRRTGDALIVVAPHRLEELVV